MFFDHFPVSNIVNVVSFVPKRKPKDRYETIFLSPTILSDNLISMFYPQFNKATDI